MNQKQIQLVKQSWSYVITRSDEAGELFYSRLFEVAPDLKHLFSEDIKTQARKLMSMVTLIVSKLDKLDMITTDIKSLASRHGRYGAKKEHYAVVGECLVWTLKAGLEGQNRWSEETEEAWLAVYKILSNAMTEGAVA